MKRYQTRVDDGTFLIESEDGWIEVGEMDDIIDLVGGPTYTVTYGKRERTVSWLDTDEDGSFSFDVRETLTEITFDREFVMHLSRVPADETDDSYPRRASYFADAMMGIWDAKGSIEQ